MSEICDDAAWFAFTAALGYGDGRTERSATPEELIPIIERAFTAEREHSECEARAEAEGCARGETDCPDDCHHRESPYWPTRPLGWDEEWCATNLMLERIEARAHGGHGGHADRKTLATEAGSAALGSEAL